MNPRCQRCANTAGWMSITGNVLLAFTKWVAGLTCNSQALIADALHSSVDVVGSVVTVVMLKVSRRAPSRRYPYGLAKLEDIAAMIIYLILVAAGTVMVVEAIHSIVTGNLKSPGLPALIAAALSIGINMMMYYFITCAGRHTNSPSLIALGYENRVDALSSVAALIGIFGATLGATTLDPLAAVVVAAIIVVESLKELNAAARNLTDAALPRSVRAAIAREAAAVSHVDAVLAVKTRTLGPRWHADIDIQVDPDVSVEAAQAIADAASERVRTRVEGMTSVRVCAHPSRGAATTRAARILELLTVMGELRSPPRVTHE